MFSKVENTSFTLSQSPSPSGHASSARSSLTLIPESNVRAPLSATPTKGVEKLMYKSNLSSYCQRLCLPHPVYGIVSQGARHALRFSSTVTIGRKMFASPNTFSNRKSAEQDAAKFALQHLLNEDEAIVTNMRGSLCEFVCQDKALCKMVLNEFLAKIKMECAYETVQVEMTPWFVSYLALNGTCYRGGGRKKKVAEQLAALAAILSLLGMHTYS
ncbi:unnamed protein product [Thlaspi arvense]|uniref:DRBM domain-containing protein n=1 Tax=Thlaspi arvense TaxID=13288 RepID=A0AAU9T096_THLAR|nr:unnamed protein product [Thlaspi arvense]